MRKTALCFGSSSGSNPRLGDFGESAQIERRMQLGREISHISHPNDRCDGDRVSTNVNHAGRFIENIGAPGYMGYKPRFKHVNHFE